MAATPWLRVGQSFPRIGTPMTVAGTSMLRASPPPQAWPLQGDLRHVDIATVEDTLGSAAWAHNRTSSSHSSLVGPRARPSQRPQSACSHLQTGASGAEERRWVDHDRREKRLPRPTRLELESEVLALLSALVLALV